MTLWTIHGLSRDLRRTGTAMFGCVQGAVFGNMGEIGKWVWEIRVGKFS